MAEEPNWLKVIRAWCSQPGRTGSTFPFVFGAVRSPPGAVVPDETRAHQEFETLIAEMKSHQQEGESLAVHQCSVIKQPVITIQLKRQAPQTDPWADVFRDVDNLHISLPAFASAEAEMELWRRSRAAISRTADNWPPGRALCPANIPAADGRAWA